VVCSSTTWIPESGSLSPSALSAPLPVTRQTRFPPAT
jgi:hypothetical protein